MEALAEEQQREITDLREEVGRIQREAELRVSIANAKVNHAEQRISTLEASVRDEKQRATAPPAAQTSLAEGGWG
ncbi:hypothetical protein T484DRAFT_1779074 [Baffinella frigidus]|nr:hypothetical protein T484DRAFT_1779074 [Cryptophyta sp. CCMP2293]